jgi:exopolyphosphatase/pppGpp-phosphohydrolase
MTTIDTDGATLMSQTLTDERISSQVQVLKRWVISKLGKVDHERRVARIAMALVAVSAPLHAFSPRHRRLLRLGALVHDVGRGKTRRNHARIGAKMILASDAVPLRKSQRRALAYLTLYHRGEVPPLADAAILKKSDDREGLRMVLAFLRTADALDGRSLNPPRLTFSLHRRRLRVDCRLDSDCAKSRRVFSRRKKFRLLEELLGCRVEVNIRVPAYEMVA